MGESMTRASLAGTKRFIVEDSFTKVTSDGEPHEMLTIVAVVSGLMAACAILAVLVSLVVRNNSNNNNTNSNGNNNKNQRSKKGDIESGLAPPPHAASGAYQPDPRGSGATQMSTRSSNASSTGSLGSVSVATISGGRVASIPEEMAVIGGGGNLSGNLNAAFLGSELSLAGVLRKGAELRNATPSPPTIQPVEFQIHKF